MANTKDSKNLKPEMLLDVINSRLLNLETEN